MKHPIYLILTFMSLINAAHAQDEPQVKSKLQTFNVHGEASTLFVKSAYAINFEVLFPGTTNGNISFGPRVGFGAVNVGGFLCETQKKANGGLFALTFLSGKGNSYFEINFGRFWGNFKSTSNNNKNLLNCEKVEAQKEGLHGHPIFDLGYRYQNREDGLLFKIKIGNTGVGLGIGIAF